MARVIPFAALRPSPEYADRVAAPPYDVLSVAEAKRLAAGNPYSFLHVDKSEIDLGEVPPHDPALYAKARENLDALRDKGILIQDAKPCLYIYRLTMQGRVQTGLAACVSAEDYTRGVIKKHELTRNDKEQDRIDHIAVCSAHTGPIFMAYNAKPEQVSVAQQADQSKPQASVARWAETHAPEYDFTADDGVRHTLWVVNEASALDEMVEAFAAIPCLYIADGHHRSAAAAAVAMKLGAVNAGGDKPQGGQLDADKPEAGAFLAVLFPHDELLILDYNRVVRDLNGYTPETFIRALSGSFEVEESESPVKPAVPGVFGLYMAGKWYRLTGLAPAPEDVVDGLAVSILQATVLSPLLGITNPQTDKRIDFVGGARGTDGLQQRVDSGEMAAAFTLCPTAMTELMAVSDAGRIMPPKSTWFEPKLRSGLLIHPF